MGTSRVKICGITSCSDARDAASYGADAIGLVFYSGSKRVVEIDQAAKIARAVGPFVTVVALFVDAEEAFVQSVLEQVPVGLLQFHGNETPAYCEQFSRPYIKALRMKPGLDVAAEAAAHNKAVGILLDAYTPGTPGGTGETFDWDRVPADLDLPIVLAGGLNPENVQSAIQQTHCYGVDVSGGVEQAPGLKNATKVKEFIINASLAK